MVRNEISDYLHLSPVGMDGHSNSHSNAHSNLIPVSLLGASWCSLICISGAQALFPNWETVTAGKKAGKTQPTQQLSCTQLEVCSLWVHPQAGTGDVNMLSLMGWDSIFWQIHTLLKRLGSLMQKSFNNNHNIYTWKAVKPFFSGHYGKKP